jgi:hypothetical protein
LRGKNGIRGELDEPVSYEHQQDYGSDGDYEESTDLPPYDPYAEPTEGGYEEDQGLQHYDYGEGDEGANYDGYFYGNQYTDPSSPGDGRYYDQEGRLIDPSTIAGEEQADRNERTIHSSDYLRDLAL